MPAICSGRASWVTRANVAVDGAQGKTSTKDLLAAVLSSAAPTTATIGSLNNELGVPLTMLRAALA